MPKHLLNNRLLSLLAVLALIAALGPAPLAQEPEDLRALQQRAADLMRNNNYADAVPVLEKIAAAKPEDAETRFHLGFALLARNKTLKNAEARRRDRVRARQELEKAKQLGYKSPLMDNILASLPPDGGKDDVYSANEEADNAIRDGEAAYVQGNLQEAVKHYQRALQLDPKLYEAALFAGDMYFKMGDFTFAEDWFQKAIAINPNRETAWRYSATPLMRQGKLEIARERYIEAFICEPYNNLARSGLVQWGQRAGVRLAHPDIKIPTSVETGPNGQVNITLGMSDDKKDGSSAWIMYGILRAGWSNGKDGKLSELFSKAYPNEKTYRHSLAEEKFALGAVLNRVREDVKNKKIGTLDPSLAKLIKLEDAGLLESYILLARPDNGIVQDHPAYLKANRDKLRRYVVEYVLTGGEG